MDTTIHRTTQFTSWEECGPCSVFARYTLAFALQMRKKTEKPQLYQIIYSRTFLDDGGIVIRLPISDRNISTSVYSIGGQGVSGEHPTLYSVRTGSWRWPVVWYWVLRGGADPPLPHSPIMCTVKIFLLRNISVFKSVYSIAVSNISVFKSV